MNRIHRPARIPLSSAPIGGDDNVEAFLDVVARLIARAHLRGHKGQPPKGDLPKHQKTKKD